MAAPELTNISARRICIIKPSALGDVVQTLPLLGPLRRRFPEATISWVINRGLAGLLADHPKLDEIIPFDRHGGLRGWWRLLRQLRRGRFDLVLDLQGLLRSAVMSFATGAPLRVGLETAREGASLACHVTLPETGRLMAAHARYWRVAAALGVGDQPRTLELAISQTDWDEATQLLQGLPRPIIGVHAGAKWATKRWPADKFAAVAGRAMRERGASIVILGSGDETALAANIAEQIGGGHVRNLAGGTSLKQLAAVLQSVNLVLSNDSGPMHLAAELGTPVVGVFTCTDPVRSGPPGMQHQLVASCVTCAGSYQKVCPHRGAEHLACFRELSTERVFAAVTTLLERLPLPARSA